MVHGLIVIDIIMFFHVFSLTSLCLFKALNKSVQDCDVGSNNWKAVLYKSQAGILPLQAYLVRTLLHTRGSK